mmetsp:Transcript_5236/g.12439  ORF Transcript_5236/g.12439 Transcript_5236/m.12439 type:complete len:210 (-) Transcript_5236:606-1235(-)
MLVGVRLDEFPNPQATGIPASCLGRKRVVGADHFVTVCDIGLDATEKRTIVAHVLLEELPVAVHDLDMFRGDIFGHLEHLSIVLHHNDFTVVGPGLACSVSGRNHGQLFLNLCNCCTGELLAGRHKDCRRIVSVLGLPEQVRSTDLCIDAVVAQQKRFCWSRQKVNAHLAENLLLRLCHKSVARSDDQIHRSDGFGPIRHCRDGLRPSH